MNFQLKNSNKLTYEQKRLLRKERKQTAFSSTFLVTKHNATIRTHAYLRRRNRPARIIRHNPTDNTTNPRAPISAPHEIETRLFNRVLALARRNRRRNQRLGVPDAPEVGGFLAACLEARLDEEDEGDEEEGGEELDKGGSFAPPRDQEVLPQQRLVLLEQQRKAALQSHRFGFSGPECEFSGLVMEVREAEFHCFMLQSDGFYLLFLERRGFARLGRRSGVKLPD